MKRLLAYSPSLLAAGLLCAGLLRGSADPSPEDLRDAPASQKRTAEDPGRPQPVPDGSSIDPKAPAADPASAGAEAGPRPEGFASVHAATR